MKHLATIAGSLAFALAITAMSFTVKDTPAPKSTAAHTKPTPKKARDTYYYFYDLNDNYVRHATAIQEEYYLENIYYVYVDENPAGGDLLEEGYVMPGKPHVGGPDCYLYGHFDSFKRK